MQTQMKKPTAPSRFKAIDRVADLVADLVADAIDEVEARLMVQIRVLQQRLDQLEQAGGQVQQVAIVSMPQKTVTIHRDGDGRLASAVVTEAEGF